MTADRTDSTTVAPTLSKGQSLFLLATVFSSGAAVMIVEMTAARALQPFFGSTTYVWTNVIAVVLAALSVGYAFGGWLADRRPSPVLLYGTLGAGALLLVACGWLVTPVSRMFLTEGLNLEGVVTVLSRGSFGATLILFAPPIALLGMISPLAIRLLAEGGVGKAAGRVFGISTVGSILGTYLPTLVLVPWIGSRGSILVSAAILGLFGATGLLIFGKSGKAVTTALVLVGVMITRTVLAATTDDIRPARGAPPLDFGGKATVLAEVESEYQYLTVRDDVWPNGEAWRILTINEGVYTYHSLKVRGSVLTNSRYYDDYTSLPFLLDLPLGSELRGCVIGLACGTNVAQWRHFWEGPYRLSVDGAELDPEIVRLGREFFDLPGPEQDWLRVYEMDGRQLLECLPRERRYHLLVVDAFTHELYIPFHLGTIEFFDLCRKRLEPGGILAMNVYAGREDSPNLLALQNTLATSFGRCVRVQQYNEGNYLLLASASDDFPVRERLHEDRIDERFRDWDGFREWSERSEWQGLRNLTAWLHLKSWPESNDRNPGGPKWVEVVPTADALVLTDDKAPLEKLTDTFLDDQEAGLVDAQTDAGPEVFARRAGFLALRAKQGQLLWAAGLGWSLVLSVAGFLVFRPRTTSRS